MNLTTKHFSKMKNMALDSEDDYEQLFMSQNRKSPFPMESPRLTDDGRKSNNVNMHSLHGAGIFYSPSSFSPDLHATQVMP